MFASPRNLSIPPAVHILREHQEKILLLVRVLLAFTIYYSVNYAFSVMSDQFCSSFG